MIMMMMMMIMMMTMDDNGYAAAALITSILSLFFVSGNFYSFAQVFIYTSHDKKEEQQGRSVFLSQLYPSNS
jgi:heme/copper-type cytochrome/quinol oxidase subunit 3